MNRFTFLLSLLASSVLVFCIHTVFAGTTTLTTYYPAPAGN